MMYFRKHAHSHRMLERPRRRPKLPDDRTRRPQRECLRALEHEKPVAPAPGGGLERRGKVFRPPDAGPQHGDGGQRPGRGQPHPLAHGGRLWQVVQVQSLVGQQG